MALVPTPVNGGEPVFAEVDMGADSSAPTVRATVVQASTVFYDTPATLGFYFLFLTQFLSFMLVSLQFKVQLSFWMYVVFRLLSCLH